MSQRLDTDVVVVGAGLAGLSAARSLGAAGSHAVVLEARSRVGGRVLNHDLGNGDVVELGGEWIGPAQLRVNKLVAELGLETFPTYNEGEHILDLHGRIKRYTGDIPPLPAAALVDLGQSQLRSTGWLNGCRSKRRGRPNELNVGTRKHSRRGCGTTPVPRAPASFGKCSPKRCSQPNRKTSRCCTRSRTRTPVAA